MKRVFLIVLDSVGIGACADSHDFGDVDVHTLKSCSTSPHFHIPNLLSLGIGNIDGQDFLSATPNPTAAVARLKELSKGKDTTIGHWEIAGIVSPEPLPTYPEGFPPEVIDAFREATGRGVLCNLPYSGTKVLDDYGDMHVKTGDLIVYTSADSVFQIAAHEDVVPLETLYEYCRIARRILRGKHGVGRVIARPFVGGDGKYTRTANRHDFSLEPAGDTMLDMIRKAGLDTVCVGKISDIFAGQGVSEAIFTHSNKEGMEVTLGLLDKDFHGLCFVNLVDFDMLYGHRRNVDAYAQALSEFDAWLPSFLERMHEDDILMITADHGCDPAYAATTDHTREYTPWIIYANGITNVNMGTLSGFSHIAATICDILEVPYTGACESKADDIL